MFTRLREDIDCILERDPAARSRWEVLLYPGVWALGLHRVAHWLWHHGHRDFALYLQSRSAEVFQTDIHPAARIGKGIFLDHATGLVVGATAVIEDDVFLGPSCVLTNVTNPRSQINRHSLYEKTLIRRGATVGANATIVCGTTLGRYCFVAAGSVVTKDVPDYALMMGNPARRKGWMSRHGHVLGNPDKDGVMACPESGFRYRLADGGATLRCLDLDEDAPLPPELRQGTVGYRAFKSR